MQQEPGTEGTVAGSGDVPRVVWRLRIVAICAALTALAFLQDPGLTAIDTKVDLAEDPLGWLERALQIWDPTGTFGQLQNQAYGYLWPMGPFFLLGDLIGVPSWVVQRLWWALVMIVAFTGVVRLSGRLGIGSPWARLIAGVAFALSPRMLTELGPISVEAWPSAVAPWVLVPLIGLAHGAAIRPAVTRSAIAVACAGGVNATAVFAVVPLAGLWLLSLQPMRRRLQALLAWAFAVLCATAWWLVPLFVLGRYSPPFLDYIETAASTTAPTDLVSVLRGASHWHAYLSGPYGASWSAGWELATSKMLIAATVAVACLGLAGLSRRGLPHRRFLVTGLLVGLAMVGFGYTGAVSGLFSGQLHAFLDAAGAPLRNVHKFDVVLRLPLALGLAYLLGLLGRAATVGDGDPSRTPAARWVHPARLRAALVTGTALIAVGVVATPALAGGMAAQGSYSEVPGYWREASDWLDDNLENEHVLVVPAARFPRYLWGSPSDEITQPLLESRWGVRSSIPLTPPATIRLLDSIDSVLSSGTGSAGLADVLARSGVRYLLLRSDLDYGRSGATPPMVARQALQRSPGLRRVTAFGPEIGGGRLPGVFADNGFDVPVQALEVWGVAPKAEAVAAYDAASLTTVIGGPESMMSLAAAGQLPAGPTILAGDRPDGLPAGPVTLTDGLRRREVSFGLLRDNASATMTAEEEGWLAAPARDYLPDWGDEHSTTARYLGVQRIRASSSWSEAEPMSGARPAHQPYAAMDRDLNTSWRSAPGTSAVGQWLELELTDRERIDTVVVTFDRGTDSIPTAITVATDREQVRVTEVDQTVEVALTDPSPINRLRISIDAVVDVRMGFGGVGIAELSVGDVRAVRTLLVPPSPIVNRAASVVLEAAPAKPACYFHDDRPVCSGELTRHSEDAGRIDRTLDLPGAAQYRLRMWARASPGGPLNALLDPTGAAAVTRGIVPTVVASSEAVPDPAARAGVVVDGDPETTWYAASDDAHPWLQLAWPTEQTIRGLRLALSDDAAAARPLAVTVLSDQGSRSGILDEGGSIVFEDLMRATAITVLITETQGALSHDPYVNLPEPLTVGVSEVAVLPEGKVRPADQHQRVQLPCGTGPTVNVDGQTRTTALVASRRELLELREVEVALCGADAARPVPATSGEVRVVAVASTVSEPTRLALIPRGNSDGTVADAAAERPVEVRQWQNARRLLTLQPSTADQIVVLRENVNEGWEAIADGVTLTPLTIDGWQQGWLVPAGVTELELRFAPNNAYVTALAGGAVLLGGTGLLAMVPGRAKAGAMAVSVPARRRRPVAAAVIGAIALLTVGGLTAAGVALLAAAVFVVFAAVAPILAEEDRRQLRQGLRMAGNWLPPACLVLAGWLAIRVDDFPGRWAQLAALAGITVLWLSVVAGRRRGQ
ncbi:alpha-(1-_3)-arabinofuranosyltransferase family protein [Micromonosporaceae bacterium DT194]|uniref:alpha-(1->3)-arabinofuranosyltransferase domain-containing protein n=1 Tax=Melissospora conviva TaxID=3388432 RepID=UPI003C27F694